MPATPATVERKRVAASLQDASYGDRDAKRLYLRLSAAADAEAAAYEATAATLAGDDAEWARERARSLRKRAASLRGRARASSASCYRACEARRRVLGRKLMARKSA